MSRADPPAAPKVRKLPRNQCEGKTASGARCRVPSLDGERYCLHHHPDKAPERAARNTQHMRYGIDPAKLMRRVRTKEQLVRFVGEAMVAVATGELTHQQGGCLLKFCEWMETKLQDGKPKEKTVGDLDSSELRKIVGLQ